MQEEATDEKPQKTLKRKLKSESKTEKSQKNRGQKKEAKQPRLFFAKDFRKRIGQDDKISALKQFLEAIKINDNHDYIFDYLENGGNCLELLQIMENDSTVPPTLIFELVTHLLLKISTMYTQYENSTYEACKYLINNYISVVHKMLGLSSSKDERKACLKLLTAMVTFSSNLAKDVLLNVKFHSANIELLTKHVQEKNSVRDYFIHFLAAFLVDGNEHILSILLEKGGLLTSIISGLQYDIADTVCIVITAMKNHILENPKVSRTMKMSVFNTSVIRDFVNLYNWRGPDGLKMLEKNNKIVYEVEKYEKSKVSECVHNFLTVLCTSHKYGVIFKDPSVGLGKKNQNALIYTVLESLAKPWEHSYASDLVLNICRACPDLVKTTWTNLKTFLEPRLSEKWISTLAFARKLLQILEPSCIEYCARSLTAQQLAQVIELLVAPLPILKTLLPENNKYENPAIKQHISVFLFDMLESVQSYLKSAKSWLDKDSFNKVKNHLNIYVSKNFPSAQTLLKDWKELSEESDTKFEYLGCILDILSFYQKISPTLLHNLTPSDLDLTDLLQNLNSLHQENELFELLQIKIVNLFLKLDQTYFSPNTKMFKYIFPLLIRSYHKIRSKDILDVLINLLKNTGIFEDSFYEIKIWCNGILNLESCSDTFGENLVQIIQNTSQNITDYHKEISNIQVENPIQKNVESILENLLNMGETTDSVKAPRQKHFSPFLLGVLKNITEHGGSKYLKKYLEFALINLFHSQVNLHRFGVIVDSYKQCLPSNIVNYVEKWISGESTHLEKMKGTLSGFQKFSEQFLTTKMNLDLFDEDYYVDFKQDILQSSVFYYDNLVNTNNVQDIHTQNFMSVINILNNHNDVDFECVLNNPNLIKHFDILRLNKNDSTSSCTKTIFEIVSYLKKSGRNIDHYLKIYCDKIYNSIFKVIKKPKKYNDNIQVFNILNVFKLNYNQVTYITKKLSTILDENFDITESLLFDVLCYSLNRIFELSTENFNFEPLESKEINIVSKYFGNMAKENKNISKFSEAFTNYLNIFPHNVADLDECLFSSVLILNEYDIHNVDLLVFLLQRNLEYSKQFLPQVDNLVDKKGVLFPLTDVLINDKNNDHTEALKNIYTVLEPSILKALQKPQKVGQHFQKDFKISVLVANYMEYTKCKCFVEKVQKFEVTEVFHVKLLEAVFNKALENELNEKIVGNIILTFVHLGMGLFKRKTKSDDDSLKIEKYTQIFNILLGNIKSKFDGDLSNVAKNETFKTFSKFCLKFGVSGQHVLLNCIRKLVQILYKNLDQENAGLLLEMLLSHSEFLDVVLGEHSETKFEVLSLMLILCKNWPSLMEKNQVPIVLSAYRGKITRCDRTILGLLKLYESKADETRFYDYKPFLWGRAAAAHYSVRSQIENALIRQPKTSDVLDLIKEELVKATIKGYPFTESLYENTETEVVTVVDQHCYDLKFLLPLFSHLLAPEQQVKTYKFTRSGALSLTVVGLSSNDKEVRKAACHVLSRFHFHLEARQTGKDNLLWIRFVEALCKGVAVLPNFKVNNFAAIFFSRMALVFTQPNHVMYQPLARYLSAKEELHLDTVPEIYTLLHSSEVNFKEHRHFILEVLRDGLRNEQDFKDFLKSMAFKLFSELFSSSVSDVDTKSLILEVISAVCKLPLAVKVLCENHSLITQLNVSFRSLLNDKKVDSNQFSQIIDIFLKIVDTGKFKLIFEEILDFIVSENLKKLNKNTISLCYKILYKVFENGGIIINVDSLQNIIENSEDSFCKYLEKYGCNFVLEESLGNTNDVNYYLRLLAFNNFKSR